MKHPGRPFIVDKARELARKYKISRDTVLTHRLTAITDPLVRKCVVNELKRNAQRKRA